MAAGEKAFTWHSWPLYALAVVLQSFADLVPAAIYERVVNATDLRPLAGVLATVYGFDVLLTPVGMLAAAEGGFAFLALLPFTVVLWLLSRERTNRLQAESLAHLDELTGGANRRSFDERLVVEQARSARSGGELSICMLDLDHFKTFNDTYGHLIGDEVLRETGRRLMRAIRTGDILAWYGGEEFVVLLPGGGVEQLAEIGERCRNSIREGSVRLPDGGKIGITASVGGASWPDNGLTVREVFDVADSALYRAKQNGRDRVELAGHGLESGDTPREARTSASPAAHARSAPRIARTRPQSCSPKAMAAWAALTARALGLDDEAQERCGVAARFHDVGKAVIPDGILTKAGPLNQAEWELLHEHPDFGAKLVGSIPRFATAASVIREHHERFDGRGYPRGIARNEISPEGQIVALCDAWVAMRSGRPYAPARSESEARAELLAARGTQFDPVIVETFLMFDEASVAELDHALTL
jgi:diguanylate cyclase (GGDEF)-like protein